MTPTDALYKAVCAAPHDDLPRLVYADWLEENGRPERAEFIRVQCRLANASPADADYVDLLERETELKAILWRELDADRPLLPSGIGWEPEHRGFAERVRFEPAVPFNQSLRRLEGVREAFPVCGLRVEQITREDYELLAKSGIRSDVRSLDVPDLTTGWKVNQRLADLLAAGEGDLQLRRVMWRHARTERYDMSYHFPAFAVSPATASLMAFHAPHLCVERFFKLGFAPTLRELSLHIGLGWFLVGRDDGLPELHSLGVGVVPQVDVPYLADGNRLPQLAHVTCPFPSATSAIHALIRRDRPLASLTVLTGEESPEENTPLLDWPWLRELQVLRLGATPLAIYASSHLTGLRHLHLAGIALRAALVERLLRAVFWQTITTLEMPLEGGEVREAEQFLVALEAPNLKHLNLKGVPLGDAGAVALAENESFANLTRLNLSACRIGPRGVEALLNSPHLQRLIELNLYANQGGEALAPLADPRVLPNLGLADVAANGVSDDLRRRLEHRPAIRAW